MKKITISVSDMLREDLDTYNKLNPDNKITVSRVCQKELRKELNRRKKATLKTRDI
jgi:hypothetical protein